MKLFHVGFYIIEDPDIYYGKKNADYERLEESELQSYKALVEAEENEFQAKLADKLSEIVGNEYIEE